MKLENNILTVDPHCNIETTQYSGNSDITQVIFTGPSKVCANAFKECTSLQRVKLVAGVELDRGSFESCTSLKNLTIPTGAKIIDNDESTGHFTNCSGLEKVTIGRSVDIATYAFQKCKGIKELNLGGYQYISMFAFEESLSLLKTLDIGPCSFVGPSAFEFSQDSALEILNIGSGSRLDSGAIKLSSRTLSVHVSDRVLLNTFFLEMSPAIAHQDPAHITITKPALSVHNVTYNTLSVKKVIISPWIFSTYQGFRKKIYHKHKTIMPLTKHELPTDLLMKVWETFERDFLNFMLLIHRRIKNNYDAAKTHGRERGILPYLPLEILEHIVKSFADTLLGTQEYQVANQPSLSLLPTSSSYELFPRIAFYLQPGATLHHLKKAELNNEPVMIKEYLEHKGRYVVQLLSGKELSIKPENLTNTLYSRLHHYYEISKAVGRRP